MLKNDNEIIYVVDWRLSYEFLWPNIFLKGEGTDVQSLLCTDAEMAEDDHVPCLIMSVSGTPTRG